MIVDMPIKQGVVVQHIKTKFRMFHETFSRAVAGMSPFSTLILFSFIPRNKLYFSWYC